MNEIIKVDPTAIPSFLQKWEPLEELVGSKNCGQFNFIGVVSLVDQSLIYCYKHRIMRYFINLSEDGKSWLYDVEKKGYYQFETDREHVRTVINLGGNPFIIGQFRNDGGRLKVAGYVYQGKSYCSDCIKNQASVGGEELVLVPLYGDGAALNKKCEICKQVIRGGLRNESTEDAGPANLIREVKDYLFQLA